VAPVGPAPDVRVVAVNGEGGVHAAVQQGFVPDLLYFAAPGFDFGFAATAGGRTSVTAAIEMSALHQPDLDISPPDRYPQTLTLRGASNVKPGLA
jgi:hypothetical protein